MNAGGSNPAYSRTGRHAATLIAWWAEGLGVGSENPLIASAETGHDQKLHDAIPSTQQAHLERAFRAKARLAERAPPS